MLGRQLLYTVVRLSWKCFLPIFQGPPTFLEHCFPIAALSDSKVFQFSIEVFGGDGHEVDVGQIELFHQEFQIDVFNLKLNLIEFKIIFRSFQKSYFDTKPSLTLEVFSTNLT